MKQRGVEEFGEEFDSSPRVLLTLFPQIHIQTWCLRANILAFLRQRAGVEEEGVRSW